jgi:hypothetical protein
MPSKRKVNPPKRYATASKRPKASRANPNPNVTHTETDVDDHPTTSAQGAMVNIDDMVNQITAKVLQVLQANNTDVSDSLANNTTEVDTTDTSRVVTDALQTLINGNTGEFSMEPAKAFHSISNPLGSYLPRAIKSKIWANEYVNISALLDSNQDDDISLTLKKSGGKPTISLSTTSKWEITSIELWTKAFLVLAAVYTEKYPQEAPQLFKYMSVVRELAFQ